MNEPLTIFPAGPAGVPQESFRRRLLRRLLALLAVGGAAFALTTWTLVRFDIPTGSSGLFGSPASVVKAHLEALNRGEPRAAYDLFSRKYRQQVSFEAYHQLVVAHRGMFRTRELRFTRNEESSERAVLEAHLLAGGGGRYVARFTLVRAEGRWWIDDLRWRAERDHSDIIAV